MKFKHQDKLDSFLREIDQYLMDEKSRHSVVFSAGKIEPWDGAALANENEEFLAGAAGRANVYFLFTAAPGSDDYKLRYIGKSKRGLARQRLRNHLFQKHARTGAKLGRIMSHVEERGTVKVSWVSVEPESLRNWVEEELISTHREADWNRENV